ncbi:MAG: hypothetical protein H7Z72_04995 [Bacteroidetes bacterium]|nr:hypothetical protein [Fibrella sp.]
MVSSIKYSLWVMLLVSSPLFAQTTKSPVYGEVGLGIGQTLFGSQTKAKLQQALGGGGFDPGTGNNISMAFYVAPETWRGLGIGSRIRGTFGAPVDGSGGDSYIFNYYNLALSAKYYPSGQFSKGLYGRGSVGFGQFTAKRLNEESTNKTYVHQYALGTSLMAGAGYTFPFRRTSLSIEAEWESSSRTGTVDQVGEVNFRSGQLGLNVILGF